jgi:ATP-dependent protease Clp ATPase subunit
MSTDSQLQCSFCEKAAGDVRWLIAGPKNVFICDACVDLSSMIVGYHRYIAVRGSVVAKILPPASPAPHPETAGAGQ